MALDISLETDRILAEFREKILADFERYKHQHDEALMKWLNEQIAVGEQIYRHGPVFKNDR